MQHVNSVPSCNVPLHWVLGIDSRVCSGRIIVSLVSKEDVMYSNAYLSSLGACLSDVNCGAFDILVIDCLRASKKVGHSPNAA